MWIFKFSTERNQNGYIMNNKIDLSQPFVGGASAIAIGAAIGTGVVSDKGIDLARY
jgi:hypothetical protein